MEKRDLYEYYAFGYNYNNFKSGEDSLVKDAISSIDEFMEFIKKYHLKVTLTAIGDDLNNIKNELLKLDQNSNLPTKEKNGLKRFIESIDKTLDAELQMTYAYILSEKRLGLTKLLTNVQELFSEGSYTKLSDICKNDFREAGQCTAFERYTAAAFHILRATEEALRLYYDKKVKSKKIRSRLWYDMTEDLKKRKGVSSSLIAVLNAIREDFRNPTAHPEKIYGEDEVQSLFTHCIDVVNRITKEL